MVQSVKDQQPAAEWFTKIEKNLNGFQRLNAAYYAYDRRKNAVIGAGLIGFFGFFVQAAVAGAVRPLREIN